MDKQSIILDLLKSEFKTVIIKQYDKNSRNLNITCTSNGSINKLNCFSYVCKIKMFTPKGRILHKNITILDDGTISIFFDEDMICESGTSKIEIQVIDNINNIILSKVLTIIIIGSMYL